MKQLVDRYFFGPVDPARSWILLRGFLVLLAFDAWLDLVPHGGRYGVGEFNVAHFGVLDALQPTPSPSTYVGVLLFVGLLAFAQAVTRPTRAGLALLFVSYTYGWAMSMLDSYQHHYLLSLLLFSAIFFPLPSAEEALEDDARSRKPSVAAGGVLLAFGAMELVLGLAGTVDTPLSFLEDQTILWGIRGALVLAGVLLVYLRDDPEAAKPTSSEDEKPNEQTSSKTKKSKSKAKKKKKLSSSGTVAESAPKVPPAPALAWGYASLCVTCAIVYFYTAITKMSPDWREGHALRRIGRSEAFRALEQQATSDGLPLVGTFTADEFWEFMAHNAILVQLVTCVGFLLAARIDVLSRRLALVVGAFSLAPLSFHIGAERLSLEIGWFSFYMLMVVVVVFLPKEAVRAIVAGLSAPARKLSSTLRARRKDVTDDPRFEAGVFAFVGGAVVVGVLLNVDLPGDLGAGIGAALVLVAAAFWAVRSGRASLVRGWSAAAIVAGLTLWVSIANTDVRFDYYRFVGGDHRRRGELEEALDAYVKANRYVVTPHCVRVGGARGRGDPLECFRSAEAAQAYAGRRSEWGVYTRDRQSQEDQVRQQLQQQR